MYRFSYCIFSVFVSLQLFGGVLPVKAQELQLVFTGNTHGEYLPCPICSERASGGLAKRATVLDTLRKKQTPMFMVAGPYEFLVPGKKSHTQKNLPQALAEAHTKLAYDAMILHPLEKNWLTQHNVSLSKEWIVQASHGDAKVFQAGDTRIGLLVFPALLNTGEMPDKKMTQNIAKKAEFLRDKADLVVGVSSWGALAEDFFIKQEGPALDILLGTGPGPGLVGRFMAEGKTFWTRAYTQGKLLHVIKIAELPRRTPGWRWEKNKNIHMSMPGMGKQTQDTQAIVDIFTKYNLPLTKNEGQKELPQAHSQNPDTR